MLVATVVLAITAALPLASPAQASPGQLDPTFSLDPGTLHFQFAHPDATLKFSEIIKMVNQPDGKLVVAGGAADARNRRSAFVARFLPSGKLDPSFGDNGVTRIQTSLATAPAFGSEARALTIGPEGKILIAGFTHSAQNRSEAFISQLSAEGQLDAEFGTGGIMRIQASPANVQNPSTRANSVGIQFDAGVPKIVATGLTRFTNGHIECFAVRLLPNGSLDSFFGDNGLAHVDASDPNAKQRNSGLWGAAIAPDGKIVAVGSARNQDGRELFLTLRWCADGKLDPAFGHQGIIRTQMGSASVPIESARASDVRIAADGKIVVGGSLARSGDGPAFAALRLLDKGQIDRSFGSQGTFSYAIGRITKPVAGRAATLEIGPDGSIAVVYQGNDHNGPISAALRIRPNGHQDRSFGTDGHVVLQDHYQAKTDHEGGLNDLVIEPDGALVVAGGSFTGPDSTHCTLQRLLRNGKLDPQFSSTGISAVQSAHPEPTKRDSQAYEAMLAPDGKIVGVGAGTDSDGNTSFVVVRLLADGRLDAGFGQGGIVRFQPSHPRAPAKRALINSIVFDRDGKIVVAGTALDAYGMKCMAVARLLPDGSLDQAFGNSGIIRHQIARSNGPEFWSEAAKIGLGQDGNILVAGTVRDDLGCHMVLLRLLADGSIDTTFGSRRSDSLTRNGIVRIAPHHPNSHMQVSSTQSLLVQPDGDILLSGDTHEDRDERCCVVLRLKSDGRQDMSFGSGGIARIRANHPTAAPNGLCLTQSLALWFDPKAGKTKLIAGGTAVDETGKNAMLVMRLTHTGQLDRSFGDHGLVLTKPAQAGRPVDSSSVTGVGIYQDKIIISGTVTLPDGSSELAMIALSPNGSRETDFGQDGISRFQTCHQRAVDQCAIASWLIMAGDKIILSGLAMNQNNFACVAFARFFCATGQLDRSFGDSGVSLVHASYDGPPKRASEAHAVAVQADGKIVTAGSASDSNSDESISVARFEADGQQDFDFASQGVARLQASPSAAPKKASSARAVAVAPDGKIVVAGSALEADGSECFVIARFLADGRLDPDFGTRGITLIQASHASSNRKQSRANALVLQPERRTAKIVAFGTAHDEHGHSCMTMMRLGADGRLDTQFGSRGITRIQASPPGLLATDKFSSADAAVSQSDNKILLAGSARDDQGELSFALTRILPGGQVDASFANQGVLLHQTSGATGTRASTSGSPPTEQAAAVASAAAASSTATAKRPSASKWVPRVPLDTRSADDRPNAARVELDELMRESQCASADALELEHPGKSLPGRFSLKNERSSQARGIAIQAQSKTSFKIVVTGVALNHEDEDCIATARFLPNGTVDQTFGDNGVSRVQASSAPLSSSGASSVVIQRDNIIVAGLARENAQLSMAVVRLLSNGQPDTTFGDNSIVRIQGAHSSATGGSSAARAIAIQTEERAQRLIMTGRATDERNQNALSISRLVM